MGGNVSSDTLFKPLSLFRFSFQKPFYVTVVVTADDDDCRLPEFPVKMTSNRGKRVRLRVERALRNRDYLEPICTSLVVTIVIVLFAFLIMGTKKLAKEEDVPDEPSVYYSPKESADELRIVNLKRRNEETEMVAENVDVVDNNGDSIRLEREVEPEPTSLQPISPARSETSHERLKKRCLQAAEESKSKHDMRKIAKGLDRLNENARLTHMTTILEEDVWFRRNRSRVYFYLVPLLSLFYFIPAIQFVFLVKGTEEVTGSQDLCFHNFQCSRPFWIFSDFNHVVSNVSYVLYGVFFLIIVRYKAHLLPPEQKPKNDHKSGKGILQQLSIFYAMGAALAAQGVFSVCYHICPTNHSLQFDSTMMYVMCLLGMVKIYQFRHPDANANAYTFFYFLGGIVLLEAVALYSSSWWFYGLFLAIYVAMTVYIALDCYFLGVARLDSNILKALAMDMFTRWEPAPSSTSEESGQKSSRLRRLGVRYPKRFGFALLFCAVNLMHAAFIFYTKLKNPKRSVTHIVLFILAGNLFLYICYYVFRKNKARLEALCSAYFCSPGDDVDAIKARYSVAVGGRQIPCFVSAGSVFALASFLLGALAASFYTARSANRNYSPAESRELNEDCSYADFFDNHDIWHFASASAIFTAFLALLTVDDDMLAVPREDIEVF